MGVSAEAAYLEPDRSKIVYEVNVALLEELDTKKQEFDRTKKQARNWKHGRAVLGLLPIAAAASFYSTPFAKGLDRIERIGVDVYAVLIGGLAAVGADTMSIRKNKSARRISLDTVPIAETLGVALPYDMEHALEPHEDKSFPVGP